MVHLQSYVDGSCSSTVNEGKRAMAAYHDLVMQAFTQKLERLQVAACQKILDYMLFVYFKSE